MARKILVDSSNTIDIWRQKVNQMSDYIEDLDGLDATFQPGNTWAIGYPNVDRDSNIVSGINYVGTYASQIYNSLITGTAVSQQRITAKIFADSGVFDKLHTSQLWNYDSAMTLADSDATWYGDSQGTIKFDFTADSAKFRNLNVLRLKDYPDSATFGKLTITDSGHIANLDAYDSTSEVIFKNLTILGNSLTNSLVIDSALVLNIIRITDFISDSTGSGPDSGVHIDSATVGTVDINSLTMTDSPEITFLYARPFLLTDSMGYDSANQGDSGQIYFAAIQLDIDSV